MHYFRSIGVNAEIIRDQAWFAEKMVRDSAGRIAESLREIGPIAPDSRPDILLEQAEEVFRRLADQCADERRKLTAGDAVA